MKTVPRVSLGLPVYNGQRFLAETLGSLLAQTYSDIEIIISDNASTDGTESICRVFAERDPRIRYYRSEVNRGAAWNHNRVFELSRGQYFKWCAYDDLIAPDFVEKCVAVLDRDPSAVLCCTRLHEIDAAGNPIQGKTSEAARMDAAHRRFRKIIRRSYNCEEVYSLMRADALCRTQLIGAYTSSDQVLLTELALRGRFHEIPEVLFFRRRHEDSTYRKWPDRSDRWLWFDPSVGGRILFPFWRQFREYLKAIARSRAPLRVRLRCYLHMTWWLKQCAGNLVEDVYWAFRKSLVRFLKVRAPWVRTLYHRLKNA